MAGAHLLVSLTYSNGCRSGCRYGIMAAMTTREIYPNAPVVLVAVEARHPEVAPLTQGRRRTEAAPRHSFSAPATGPITKHHDLDRQCAHPHGANHPPVRLARSDNCGHVRSSEAIAVDRPGRRRSAASPSSCSSRSRRANVSLQSTALFVLACATSTRSGFRSSVTVRLVGPTGSLKPSRSIHPRCSTRPHVRAAGKELPYLTGGRAATHCPIRSARRLRGPARRAAPPVHAGSGRIFLLDIDSFWVPSERVSPSSPLQWSVSSATICMSRCLSSLKTSLQSD